MIRVSKLTKSFGRFRAVDQLDFDVRQGEAVALWGSNGAGKTTAIRCVLGLLRCSGLIEVDGLDIRRHGKQVRQRLGYVPQELAFHDDMRLGETARFFGRIRRTAADRPARVLEEVGLAGHERKRIRELSGGMKQRMALGLALLSDPPLLILDELTSNLDTEAQHGFTDLLRQQNYAGRTILFTSHRLDEVKSLADRVVVMDSGRKRLECSPDDLAESLGLRGVLTVRLAPADRAEAIAALATRGITATSENVGLSMEVAPDCKAEPISILAEHSIAVRDFDYSNDHRKRRGGDPADPPHRHNGSESRSTAPMLRGGRHVC